VTPEQFLHLADLLPDALLMLSGEGKILAANQAAAAHWVLTPAELVGRPLTEFVTDAPEDLARQLTSWSQTRSRLPGSLLLKQGDGTILACRCEGGVLSQAMGPRGGTGTGPPAEAAILLLRFIPKETASARFVVLNQKIDQLSREIHRRRHAEEELRGQREWLADRGRRKDGFLAMLAHELRNPLAPVLNGLRVLELSGGDPAVTRQVRQMMERQIRHLIRIVDDLLEVSRITQGKVTLRRERLDLGRLVRVAVQDSRLAQEQAGHELSLEAPQTPVWINGDAMRLTQVLNNLLDNARKFTPRGGTVTVRLTWDAITRQACLKVSDTGEGIDLSVLPYLFEPFSQADRSLERSRGGLGLGLALVRGLIRLHGGEAQASSGGPGQGAEFTVLLPLAGEPLALIPRPVTEAPRAAQLQILIVEDNRDAADSMRMFLELAGHKVTVVHTGPEGVRTATVLGPAVVLCDIGLPGLDGYGVARELRQNPTTAHARLIAISGYAGEDDRRRSREAGFDFHLGKPADPDTLLRLLP
jgi:signal transduction histidine kinase